MKNPTSLHRAIELGALAALHGVHTGLPGRLEAYDAKTGRAKVKPLIQATERDGTLHPLPTIASVPVYFMGGESASLYLPLKVGDTGWIAFSERSMEKWLAQGDDAPPGDPRIMDLSDAVFFPGLRPFSDEQVAEAADAAVLKNDGFKIKIQGGKIALGNTRLPLLPMVPPGTGALELLNLIAYLIDRLADPSLVVGSATINPAFTIAMQGLKLNIQQIQGDL